MATNENPPKVKIMSPTEAAKYVGLSESMMAKMRCRGGGAVYFKLGRAVRYRQDDLDEWLSARRVRHSSDAARLSPRLCPTPPPQSRTQASSEGPQ